MALLPFSSNHNYDTSLLNLEKNKSDELSNEENNSIDTESAIESKDAAAEESKDDVNLDEDIKQENLAKTDIQDKAEEETEKSS